MLVGAGAAAVASSGEQMERGEDGREDAGVGARGERAVRVATAQSVVVRCL
jgi:hypothetical protein